MRTLRLAAESARRSPHRKPPTPSSSTRSPNSPDFVGRQSFADATARPTASSARDCRPTNFSRPFSKLPRFRRSGILSRHKAVDQRTCRQRIADLRPCLPVGRESLPDTKPSTSALVGKGLPTYDCAAK